MSFVERLIFLMEANSVSGYQLSKGTGIATSCISTWKNGKTVPSVKRMASIANFFDVSIDYLAGYDDIPNRKKATAV